MSLLVVNTTWTDWRFSSCGETRSSRYCSSSGCMDTPLRAAVAAVRSLGKVRAVARLVVRAEGCVANLSAVGTACAAAIGTAQVYHSADIHAGTECGVAGAGLGLVAFADDFAGDGEIALVQTRGNLVERRIVFQLLLDDKTVIIGQMFVFHNGYLFIKAAALSL